MLTDVSPLRVPPRPSDTPQSGEPQDGASSAAGTQFDFSPSNLEQPQEEEQEGFRYSQDSETLNRHLVTASITAVFAFCPGRRQDGVCRDLS